MAVLQQMRDAMDADGYAPTSTFLGPGWTGRLHVATMEKLVDEFAAEVKAKCAEKSLIYLLRR